MDAGIEALLHRSGELVRERGDLLSRVKAIDADLSILKRAAEILAPDAPESDNILCPRENPKTGLRVEPDTGGV